jgi:cytochrome c1
VFGITAGAQLAPKMPVPASLYAHDINSFVYVLHRNDEHGFYWCAETGNPVPHEMGHIGSWDRPIHIILTVAHLNHDETDNQPEYLAHLCQRCHNRHDAKHRAAPRKASREHAVNRTDGNTLKISP